jgi:hypothetical protein
MFSLFFKLSQTVQESIVVTMCETWAIEEKGKTKQVWWISELQ